MAQKDAERDAARMLARLNMESQLKMIHGWAPRAPREPEDLRIDSSSSTCLAHAQQPDGRLVWEATSQQPPPSLPRLTSICHQKCVAAK